MKTEQSWIMSRRSLIKGATAVTALSAPIVARAAIGNTGLPGPMLSLVQLPGTAADVFKREAAARGSRVLTLDGGFESLLASDILPHAALPGAQFSGVTAGKTAFILAAVLQDRGFNLRDAQEIDSHCKLGTRIACLRQLNSDQTVHWTLVKSGVNFRA